MSEVWPYNLPIFRRSHRASSPDGNLVAEIQSAVEVGMSYPTCGTLKLSNGLRIDRCNPSFLWSDDSRYLAVPRYFTHLGLFRRQRVVLIDSANWKAVASRQTAFYYQPESFSDGLLVVTKDPTRSAACVSWRIPEELEKFMPLPLDHTPRVPAAVRSR